LPDGLRVVLAQTVGIQFHRRFPIFQTICALALRNLFFPKSARLRLLLSRRAVFHYNTLLAKSQAIFSNLIKI
jgi:hypothetical protein